MDLNSGSDTFYPDPGQATSVNFSFLIRNMGVKSFLIGLNDAKKRPSIYPDDSPVYTLPKTVLSPEI